MDNVRLTNLHSWIQDIKFDSFVQTQARRFKSSQVLRRQLDRKREIRSGCSGSNLKMLMKANVELKHQEDLRNV